MLRKSGQAEIFPDDFGDQPEEAEAARLSPARPSLKAVEAEAPVPKPEPEAPSAPAPEVVSPDAEFASPGPSAVSAPSC